MDGLDGLNAIQYAVKESCQGAGNHFGRHKTTENHVKYATGLIIEVVHGLRVPPQQLSLRHQFPSYRMLLPVYKMHINTRDNNCTTFNQIFGVSQVTFD